MSNLVDIASRPLMHVWGDTVKARRIEGERITLAVVELARDSVVPGHQHENEQLGLVIAGSVTFTIGEETRELGPGGTWRIPSNVHHRVTTGPEGAVVTAIAAPPRPDWAAVRAHADIPPVWP